MICYEYINDYIRKTIKKNEGFLAELEEFAKENHVPIVHPEVASLLRVIGLTLRPSRVLEVGTAIGYSAILFSTFLEPGGRIDTIDRYELMLEKARANVKKAGLQDVINIIEGDALEVLKCLEHKYDMIFWMPQRPVSGVSPGMSEAFKKRRSSHIRQYFVQGMLQKTNLW